MFDLSLQLSFTSKPIQLIQTNLRELQLFPNPCENVKELLSQDRGKARLFEWEHY